METQNAALAGVGIVVVAALTGILATLVVKKKRTSPAVLKQISDYDEGYAALVLRLAPADRARLERCHNLYGTFFDGYKREGIVAARQVSDLIEQVITFRKSPDDVELALLTSIKEAASSEPNMRAGLAATAEFLSIIRTQYGRQTRRLNLL